MDAMFRCVTRTKACGCRVIHSSLTTHGSVATGNSRVIHSAPATHTGLATRSSRLAIGSSLANRKQPSYPQ